MEFLQEGLRPGTTKWQSVLRRQGQPDNSSPFLKVMPSEKSWLDGFF